VATCTVTVVARTAHAKSVRHLALLRVVAQGVVGSKGGPPEAVVERLLCVQAQDLWSAAASVALRTGGSIADVHAALDGGTVVRGWLLRDTLHLAASHDLGLLHTVQMWRPAGAVTRRQLGMTPAQLSRAERIALAAVAGGPIPRAQLIEAWEAGGTDTGRQRGYLLIALLCQLGILCLGPVRNGQQMSIAAAEWLGERPALLERDEALEALARRYFLGHGPATPSDLARWANLTVRDTKAAVALARPHLAAITVEDAEYLLDPATPDVLASCDTEARDVIALAPFDELLFGYRDRAATLPDDRVAAVFPHSNGVPNGTVLFDGQVSATWKRPKGRDEQEVEVDLLVPVPKQAVDQARLRVAALTAYR